MIKVLKNHHLSWKYREMMFIIVLFFRMFCLFIDYRIVLEAGYFLQDRAFFDNIGTILLYAVVVSGLH